MSPATRRKAGDRGQALLRRDPTRSISQRRAFAVLLRKAFARLKGRLVSLVLKEDAFGLALPDNRAPAVNAFCPTGEGGGVDPSCSPGGAGTGKGSADPAARRAEDAVAAEVEEYRKIGMTPEEANGGDCHTAATNVIRAIREAGGQANFAFPMQAPTHLWVFSGGLHYDLEAPRGVKRAQDLPFFKRNPEQYSPWDDSPNDPLASGYYRAAGRAPAVNARFQFISSPDKLAAFRRFLATQFQDTVTGPGEEALWERYVTDGYRRGAGRAFDDVRRRERALAAGDRAKVQTYDGTREAFLRDSFGRPVAAEKVKLLAGRAFDELEGVTEQMGVRMGRVLADGLVKGDGPEAVARALADEVDVGRQRAEVIAATECLPAGTLVDGAVVRAAFRRWYVGPMVEVETRNARKFSATPNHPMFTQDGWVGVGALKPGDRLVCRCGEKDLAPAHDPDVQRRPTPVSEVFDALQAVGVSERVRTTQPDFHGDGADGEVQILRADRELSFGRFAPLDKPLCEEVFAPTDVILGACFCPLCEALLPVDQRQCLLCGAEANASRKQAAANGPPVRLHARGNPGDGFPGGVAAADFVRVKVGAELVGDAALLPGEGLGVGVGPAGPGRADEAADPTLVVPGLPGNLVGAEPGDVELDEVLLVRIREFSGHVYNLETRFGYYTIAGGVYTGNCSRAHNEGQLTALEQLGVEAVGVAVEWLAAETACPRCSVMEGVVLKIDEARGLIPLHPNCRCCWVPNIGESGPGQKDTKSAIDDALAEADVDDVEVSMGRPEGVLNVDHGPALGAFSAWLAGNVFCPTGAGGGVDPSCSPGGGGGGEPGGYEPGSGEGTLYVTRRGAGRPDPGVNEAARARHREYLDRVYPDGRYKDGFPGAVDPELNEIATLARDVLRAGTDRGEPLVPFWNDDPDAWQAELWGRSGPVLTVGRGKRGIEVTGLNGKKTLPEGAPAGQVAYLLHRVSGNRPPAALREEWGPKKPG